MRLSTDWRNANASGSRVCAVKMTSAVLAAKSMPACEPPA
jgi:hypothetical protein